MNDRDGEGDGGIDNGNNGDNSPNLLRARKTLDSVLSALPPFCHLPFPGTLSRHTRILRRKHLR